MSQTISDIHPTHPIDDLSSIGANFSEPRIRRKAFSSSLRSLCGALGLGVWRGSAAAAGVEGLDRSPFCEAHNNVLYSTSMLGFKRHVMIHNCHRGVVHSIKRS